MMTLRDRPRTGVTLLELIVVISIIGVLVSLLLPAVQQARSAAMRTSCQSRLRQIALALHHHHDTYESFPPGQDTDEFGIGGGSLQGTSWLTKILPYVEQQPLWEQTRIALNQDHTPWDNPPHVGIATVISVYTCPSDSRVSSPLVGPDGILAAYTSYVGVCGAQSGTSNGVLPLGYSVRFRDITDGTSNTVMVGERPPSALLGSGWWYASHWNAYANDFILYATMLAYPTECSPPLPTNEFKFGPGRINNDCDKYHFWSLHSGGANFAFADGSVRFLAYSAADVLPALASRDAGEIASPPDY